MSHPSRKNSRGILRRLVGLVVLLGVCALLFPLPFAPPASQSTDKDLSEPFPCQNRPCGCQSAAQCWKKCCCFTDTQKVAWAKANHVKLPDFVVAAAKREKAASIRTNLTAEKRETGTGEATSSCACCQKKPVAATKAKCCTEAEICRPVKSQSCSGSQEPRKPSPVVRRKPLSSKWVMAIFAAKCQGQDSIPFCLPCSVIPSNPELMTICCAVMETVSLESEHLQRTTRQPPLPPPKIAGANDARTSRDSG